MRAHLGIFAKLWNLLPMFSILMVLCLLNACTSEISDKEISADFTNYKKLFAETARLGLGTDLACYRKSGDTVTCNMPAAIETFRSLSRVTGVKSAYARNDIPQLGNAVYFVVAEYGFVTMSSYTKGLIYSQQELVPTVNSTDDKPESKYRFKKLEDHWYVFRMP